MRAYISRKFVLLLAIFQWSQTVAKQLPLQRQKPMHPNHRRRPHQGKNEYRRNQFSKTKATIVGGFASTLQYQKQNYSLKLYPDDQKRDIMHSGISDFNMAGSGFKRKVPNSDPYCLNKHQYNPLDTREQSMRNRDPYTDSDGPHFSQLINTKSRHHQHYDPSDRRLSSTDYGYYAESPRLSRTIRTIRYRISSIFSKIDVQESAIYLTYVCNIIAITLPVVLIPMIAADPLSSSTTIQTTLSPGDLTKKIIAISSIGAGLGKIINGFVCQAFGSRMSGGVYLLGTASFAYLLSTTSTLHAVAIAGMEFCASIMWTVCNVLIANKYALDKKKFTAAITALGLSSTAGNLICKIVGSALLSKYHWRDVACVASAVSALGAGVLFFLVKDEGEVKKRGVPIWSGNNRFTVVKEPKKNSLSARKIISSMVIVFSNPTFWLVAGAHTCSHLGRSSEKIIGTFINEITHLPRHVCSSLTSSLTVGFIWGLVSGRKMEVMDSAKKRQYLFKKQCGAVVSALSIAVVANKHVVSILGKNVVALAITLASGALGSFLAIQYYKVPSKFAHSFGENKAICISFADAIAFFMTSPIWILVSNIVNSGRFGSNGWMYGWLMLSGMFAIGGFLNTKTAPIIT